MANRIQDYDVAHAATLESASIQFLVYDSASEKQKLVTWAEVMQHVGYDIYDYNSGAPATNAVVLAFAAPRPLTLKAGLAGSVLKAKVAATAQTVFNIQKNGATVGTITVAAAGTTGTFAAANDIVLAAGDLLEVVAPASADATLASLRITLVANV